jgi:hypothetical protein
LADNAASEHTSTEDAVRVRYAFVANANHASLSCRLREPLNSVVTIAEPPDADSGGVRSDHASVIGMVRESLDAVTGGTITFHAGPTGGVHTQHAYVIGVAGKPLDTIIVGATRISADSGHAGGV